jgi:transposase-like protein
MLLTRRLPGIIFKPLRKNGERNILMLFWDNLTAFFEYPLEIRKMIYTTNTIESMNSTIRKYTKTKVIFPDDTAALKAIYLSINIIERKWTNQIRNWGIVLNQFLIKFENRCNL